MASMIENQQGTTDSQGKFIKVIQPKLHEEELVYSKYSVAARANSTKVAPNKLPVRFNLLNKKGANGEVEELEKTDEDSGDRQNLLLKNRAKLVNHVKGIIGKKLVLDFAKLNRKYTSLRIEEEDSPEVTATPCDLPMSSTDRNPTQSMDTTS